MAGLKVGVVRLGRAAGKVKHSLLDEEDIQMVEDFAFEARVDIDPNGLGAQIFAWCYDLDRGRASGQYVHDLIWEKHCGGIAPGWKVVHRNEITVDNRLDNLMLVPSNKGGYFRLQNQNGVGGQNGGNGEERLSKENGASAAEESLYYLAIAKLPTDPLQELMHFPEMYYNRYYNANNEVIEEDDDSNMYYECHYPPCTNMEKEPKQYSICGQCQHVRYCGAKCQEKDWPVHKRFCRRRHRPAPYLIDMEPDR